MRNPTPPPPADGGYPADSDLHQMSDDGGPVGPDPARWSDPQWCDPTGEGPPPLPTNGRPVPDPRHGDDAAVVAPIAAPCRPPA